MSLRELPSARWVLSTLLIAGAALFAIGVAAERNAVDHHGVEPTTHVEEGQEHTDETADVARTHSEASPETLLGVNLESTTLVVIAGIFSLAFALLTFRSNFRPLLLATAAFAALFAVFDIAELVHQINESRTAIAALAAVIALVHLAAVAVAVAVTPSR
jgi:hypothetical protein